MNRVTQLRTIIWLTLAALVLANIPYLSAAITIFAFVNLAATSFIVAFLFINPSIIIPKLVIIYQEPTIPQNYSRFLWAAFSLVYLVAGFPLASLASIFALIITIVTIDPIVKKHL